MSLIRGGHDRAFEVLFNRYQSRLLAFCRHLVGSPQDAEDVLQEVFAAAHAAILADDRAINARPWLYRIARNRSLNHLRRPTAEGVDSMDVHPHENGTSTLEQVQRREQLREIVSDVTELPETQRTALVLRQVDDLSYTDIAQAMGTTLPSVKSLLVRARMSLAESSEARILTCDEVRLELAGAAEGLCKLAGSARRHVRDCPSCSRYRSELRSSTKARWALAPFGLLALLRKLIPAKLGGSSGAGGAAGTAGTVGSAGSAAGTAGGVAGTTGGVAAAGSSGITIGGVVSAANTAATGIGGALGAKAAVGVATAALVTAGAVGVTERNLDGQHATPGAGRAGVSATAGATGGIGSSATSPPAGPRAATDTAGAAGSRASNGSRHRRATTGRPHVKPAPPVKLPAKPAAGSGHGVQASTATGKSEFAPGTSKIPAASKGIGAVDPPGPRLERAAGGLLRTRPAGPPNGHPSPPKPPRTPITRR
ncbi:MAG: sigma-70 family RNA polymerase sigma factor [Actinomycetota bacterium]